MNTIDITPIVQAVVALLAAVISAFLVPWIKRKAGAAQLEQMEAWTRIAVAAAEQLYTSLDGEKKKAYVLDFLAGKGYHVSSAEVENAIEAAVLELHDQLYGTEKQR